MKLKFVTFIGYQKQEVIIVFPAKAQHLRFAEAFTKNTFGEFRPVAGGFVENGKCVGESISLRMQSRPEDTKLLNSMTQG
jgi:hypothetical protein